VNGGADDFRSLPAVGRGREPGCEYRTADVLHAVDFGYIRRKRGRRARGELGGLVFSSSTGLLQDRLAAYGDRLTALTLDKSLKSRARCRCHRA